MDSNCLNFPVIPPYDPPASYFPAASYRQLIDSERSELKWELEEIFCILLHYCIYIKYICIKKNKNKKKLCYIV